jgi:hypothetical protein
MRHLSEVEARFQAELRSIAGKMGPSKQRLDIALEKYGDAFGAITEKVSISEDEANKFINATDQLHQAAMVQAQLWQEYVSTLAVFKMSAMDAIERDKRQ